MRNVIMFTEVSLQLASNFGEYAGSRDPTSIMEVEGRRVWYEMGILIICHKYFVVREGR